jgi:two-component system, LytTR family, response regulator
VAEMDELSRVRTLIVDDEPAARRTLRHLLQMDDEVEVVGECYGEETPAMIAELRPDLVFLDVQMPRMSGLQVLEALDPRQMPLVVFTTAYDEYALQAFDHAAVDYLLKPFSNRRFYQALLRAKGVLRRQETEAAQRRLLNLLAGRVSRAEGEAPPVETGPFADSRDVGLDRLVLRDSSRLLVYPVRDLVWIEARGPYVRLHLENEEALVRESLGGLEERLDAERFFRIHRSVIVNMDRVREVRPLTHGDCAVVLDDGTELKLSRTRREEFELRLGRPDGA